MNLDDHYLEALVESLLAHERQWQLYVRTDHEGVVGFPEGVATVRVPGCPVPVVVLDMGFGLPRPPEIVRTDETGLRCVLSFNATPHDVFIPWSAVATTLTDRHAVIVVERQQQAEQEPAKPALRLVD